MVLEVLCATPKHPRIPKLPPQPVPRRPPPPQASDQVTLTQYYRHRRSSLLPLAPAPKRPCPTPQFGSLLGRRASQSAPPPQRPQFGSLLPAQAPRSDPRLRQDVPISNSSATPEEVDLYGFFQHHQLVGQN